MRSQQEMPGPRTTIAACLLSAALAFSATAEDRVSEAWSDDASSYRPPVSASGPLTLLQAVERTLAHDPNLLLRQQDINLQEGVTQERAGDFDWTFTGELSYQHEERELRDSVKAREQSRRDDLTIFNRESCGLATSERARAQQIEGALGGEAGGRVNIPEDTSLQSVINFLAEEIARAPTTADRVALIAEWQRILDSELIEAREQARAAQTGCDDSQAALNRLGDTPTFEDFDSVRLNLRLEKLYRNGLFFAPFIEGDFDSTSFVGKRDGFNEPVLDETGNQVVDFGIPRERFVDFGGKNVADTYTMRVGFELNVPLLAGKGKAAVAAGEEAARFDTDATSLLLKHAASESVLRTATSYWTLLAAQERVTVLQRSVDIQTKISQTTQELIDRDEVIGAEKARVLASQANSEAQLAAAKADWVAARLALVQAMGYQTNSLEQTPEAEASFPTPPVTEAIHELQSSGRYADQAVERRYDVRASRLFIDSSQALAESARLNEKDRLDLFGRVFSTATGEDSFSEATDRWVTPSVNIAFSYERFIGNNSKKGRLAQSRAAVRQDQISSFDLERTVRISAVQTLASLLEAIERLERSKEAVKFLEQTLKDEMELFRGGESNLIDTLLTEQQQTSARLGLVEARLAVANLLAEIRFVTGTIVADTEQGPEVTESMITQIPELGS